jgi:hypothetical protein
MPPKPSFRVKLPPKQKENDFLDPPMNTSFALPGTLAERKLERKSQRESNFNIQKTRLTKWDLNLNAPSTSAPPSQSLSSTAFAFGMPTPKTPLSMLDTAHMVESEEYMETLESAAWEDSENVPL